MERFEVFGSKCKIYFQCPEEEVVLRARYVIKKIIDQSQFKKKISPLTIQTGKNSFVLSQHHFSTGVKRYKDKFITRAYHFICLFHNRDHPMKIVCKCNCGCSWLCGIYRVSEFNINRLPTHKRGSEILFQFVVMTDTY